VQHVAISLLLVWLSAVSLPVGAASAADPVIHDIDVTGTGVSMYPAFARDIERYGVTTTTATGGTLTVTASTTDPAGAVLINGRPAPGGTRTLTGMEPGDEVAVFITDADGTATYSLIYLPAGFPMLSRDTSGTSADTPSPGHVMLTLGLWTQPSSFYETAVDGNGVPAFVQEVTNSMDLKRQPNGNYSVARGTGTASGADIVELDEQFREVGRYRTVGLTHTDGHDAILLPDGSRYLLAYEPNTTSGKADAIIQHVGADGGVLFEWNSKDHVDIAAETVVGDNADYAHVNSIEVMDDGDLLVSFRHFSSVFKIARFAHDGFAEGDVVWKLGGRASDFTFTDTEGQPDGGPCAQHTATELPNGNIMVFDNGAWNLNPLCIDPANPAGPPVDRVPTRIAEWSLDEATGVATMVRDHQVGNRYAIFAGSAQPLGNGNTVIGWASSTNAVASEIDEAGDVIWDLEAVGFPKYFTYRAFKTEVPDAVAPSVSVVTPADGATYVQGERVRASFDCTDLGGSSLRSCQATGIDTSTPGTRTVTVTGIDGAGNVTSVRRIYRVLPAVHQPDAMIRAAGTKAFRGRDTYGARPRQLVTSAARAVGRPKTSVVRVQNDGNVADRFSLRHTFRSKGFTVALRHVNRRRRSPVMKPGESWTFRVEVTRRPTAVRGDRVTVRLVSRSTRSLEDRDVVWFRVRAR
jgi:hypothetical protein